LGAELTFRRWGGYEGEVFIPIATETVLTRWPYANLGAIAVISLVSVLAWSDVLPYRVVEALVLSGEGPDGWVGHVFLHGDVFHLAGNMVALWVFGNPVCETTRNWPFTLLLFLCALCAGVVHMALDGHPAIGASGMVNGVVGFYLIMFPTNRITVGYWIFFRAGTFQMAGGWWILLWMVVDAYGAIRGGDTNIGYWAHIGGLGAGIAFGWLFLIRGWAGLQSYDNPSLLELLRRRPVTGERTTRQHRTRKEILQDHWETSSMRAAVSVIHCPNCSEVLEIEGDASGQSLVCPSCNRVFEVD